MQIQGLPRQHEPSTTTTRSAILALRGFPLWLLLWSQEKAICVGHNEHQLDLDLDLDLPVSWWRPLVVCLPSNHVSHILTQLARATNANQISALAGQRSKQPVGFSAGSLGDLWPLSGPLTLIVELTIASLSLSAIKNKIKNTRLVPIRNLITLLQRSTGSSTVPIMSSDCQVQCDQLVG